ncbi:MAG: UDP-galactopyranose mutase [Coriobacteriia bacterium]|nr:UDP-galactopyranose mutase [Coriobacteriia bacterium]
MSISHGLPSDFNAHRYDMIVVGAGYAGSVVARSLAERSGMRVAVLERRDHVAGNAYDCLDEAGVLIHLYGPHIFHTYDERVYDFLSRFTDFVDYQHRVLANVHGTLMPVPFNHTSLKLAFGDDRGEQLYRKLVQTFGENRKVPILELRAQNDPELDEVADYVYENIFLHYTLKQWGQTPDQVDPAVTGRVPVLVGDDDRYFQSPFQGMPDEGYTKLFDAMLNHDLIDVFLDVDARDILCVQDGELLVCDKTYGGEVIYTGPLDELFGLDLGALPYRSLDLRFETLPQDQFQPAATVNYTTSEDFTRITEFKLMTGQVVPGATTILREYSRAYVPGSGMTPYYAILNDENRALYQRYLDRVSGIANFHAVGRLAEYRYYDMDAVVASALNLADAIAATR